MFVSTGRSTFPPFLCQISAICLAFVCVSLSLPPAPSGPRPKTSSIAVRAAAAIMPDILTPPPIDLRTHLACLMKAVEPTITLPIGAPSPFEKQRLTLSKHSQKSLILPAPAATTSQSRAPSRCNLMLFSRANAEILRTSESGMMVPDSVFSREITLVGQQWISSLNMACFSISSDVR